MDNINLKKGKTIILLINTYKIWVYDIQESGNITKILNFKKKEDNENNLQALNKNSEVTKKQDNITKSFLIKKQNNITTSFFNKEKTNQKINNDKHSNINENSSCFEFFGCLDNFSFDKKEKDQIKSLTNKPPESTEIPDISEEEKDSFNITSLCTSKSKKDSSIDQNFIQDIIDHMIPSTQNDQKKRRISLTNEDQDDFLKNAYLKKKRFKFDSPVMKSHSISRGNSIAKPGDPHDSIVNSQNKTLDYLLQGVDHNHSHKSNSKELAENNSKDNNEKELFKNYKRLRKIIEIKDENTCPICLGISLYLNN